MLKYLKFFYRLLSIITKKSRFVRLSPFSKGSLFFYDTDLNRFFKVKSRNWIDSVTADQIFTRCDYELKFLKRFEELSLYHQALVDSGKSPLIIDCGANVGYSAMYFSRTYPKAKIVAVEPESRNYELLKEHCKSYSNIEPLNVAISCVNSPVVITDTTADFNAFQVNRVLKEGSAKDLTSISSETVNDLLRKHSVNTAPFIIKIDIEGFESDLFERNIEWIESFPIIIIELHDWMLPKSNNSLNFLKAISAHKRDFVYKGENVFSIKN